MFQFKIIIEKKVSFTLPENSKGIHFGKRPSASNWETYV